jgi:hypothetical protein
VTDPFRPHPPAFPRARLLRAGLDEDTVTRLETETAALGDRERAELARYVTSHPDDAILARFTGEQTGPTRVPPDENGQTTGDAPPPPAAPTYEELNALTVDALEGRIRAWNADHPEQHLAVAGRKGELIGRLLDAYEGEQQTLAGDEALRVATAGTEQSTGGSVAADQLLPTAPTPTTPEGAPQDTAAAPAAPTGAADTGQPPAGVQQPAQTADAAGAGTATTEE